jgi:prepilin-type N-terminal cleavage/methylation domain-containing protein
MTGNIRRQWRGGFTLIECIMVIVVLAIAGAAIARINGGLFSGSAVADELQVRTGMALECMEQILNVQRQDGFDEISNATRFNTGGGGVYCDNITAQTGATPPAVTVPTAVYTGAACPSGAQCRLVTINSGPSIQLMLVHY